MTERNEYEPTPERRAVADYEGYRKVVDTLSPAFRRVGIVDEAGYDRALRDPRTVRLSIGRVEMPFITPADYVSGYDVARSSRLTGEENVFVLATPMNVLTGPDVKILGNESEFDAESSAIIVETDHDETVDMQAALPYTLAEVGEFQVGQFLDRRIRNPEQQPAMMAMYEARFTAVDDTGNSLPSQDKSFFEAYRELIDIEHPATANTKLLHVKELRHDQELIDKLWGLCSDRFDWLGEAHPVSMEDTKDFFVQMVCNDDTHTIVRYDDGGLPRCLGFFMSSLGKCPWLKPEFGEAIAADAEAQGERMAYFYGIAGESHQAAAYYGRDVMQLLSYIAHQMGGNHRLLFESTNMSSRYIPRMVGQYVGQGAGLRMTVPVAKVAQVDYWYLAPSETTNVVAVEEVGAA